jgi:hypothetical protein
MESDGDISIIRQQAATEWLLHAETWNIGSYIVAYEFILLLLYVLAFNIANAYWEKTHGTYIGGLYRFYVLGFWPSFYYWAFSIGMFLAGRDLSAQAIRLGVYRSIQPRDWTSILRDLLKKAVIPGGAGLALAFLDLGKMVYFAKHFLKFALVCGIWCIGLILRIWAISNCYELGFQRPRRWRAQPRFLERQRQKKVDQRIEWRVARKLRRAGRKIVAGA